MSKAILRQVKNIANGYSTAQVMVRNATSNEPYGPSTAEMRDVSNHTFENSELLEVMDMIDKRLNDKGKNWRHVAKALTLLDFLVRYGSENVVLWSKDNLYIIKTLREFQYTDDAGGDHGAIIRVKAKELTALLMDDERLRAERAAAKESRKRRGNRRDSNEDNEFDDDLQKALEASRMTAEDEEKRRRADLESSDSLQRALQLSLEEDELRKSRLNDQNLLDMSDQPSAQGILIGYDAYGQPVYQNQAMNTGFLQNAYQQTGYDAYQQQLLAQQQQQQQQQQQAALLQQQYEQQQAYLQQQYQQQLLAQQQQQALAQQQWAAQQQAQQQQAQQQIPMKTGSNNPFAMSNEPEAPAPAQPEEPQQPQKAQLTGSQLKNEKYSELNALLATGTGIDTFGNVGNQRIPAHHTKTQNFYNSSGAGFKTGYGPGSKSNPFFDTQYTGVPSTGMIPAYTGYGFGNAPQTSQQQPQSSQQQQGNGNGNDNKLIDI